MWLQPRLGGFCDAAKQEVLNEFPTYDGLPHPLPTSQLGMCKVAYATAASEAEVLMYYAQQLRAHGWQVDERAQEGPSESIGARRSSLFYGVDYAPDGQLTISLNW